MKIIIVKPTGSTHSINVKEDDTISELKETISQKLGIDIKQNNLNHGTLVLDEHTDGKTLRDLGLEDEGMIHVTSIFKGGF